jgi:hypothetical protein
MQTFTLILRGCDIQPEVARQQSSGKPHPESSAINEILLIPSGLVVWTLKEWPANSETGFDSLQVEGEVCEGQEINLEELIITKVSNYNKLYNILVEDDE